MKKAVVMGLIFGAIGSPAAAGESCEFFGSSYPHGEGMCQGSDYMRCWNGEWRLLQANNPSCINEAEAARKKHQPPETRRKHRPPENDTEEGRTGEPNDNMPILDPEDMDPHDNMPKWDPARRDRARVIRVNNQDRQDDSQGDQYRQDDSQNRQYRRPRGTGRARHRQDDSQGDQDDSSE